jgi:hypothetical protein
MERVATKTILDNLEARQEVATAAVKVNYLVMWTILPPLEISRSLRKQWWLQR